MPVIDRTAVILDIFAGHADTRRGQAPGRARAARVQHGPHARPVDAPRASRRRPRRGGIGTRGPGESQIETDRRLARDRISALRRRLERRQGDARGRCAPSATRAHLPQVALAGYTNAGKSTLLNALTGADVGVRDRLFHTLDPTTRTLRLHGRTYLLTDTVGFIRKLPAPARRRVRRDARGDDATPTSSSTSSTPRSPRRSSSDAARRRRRARGDRRRRARRGCSCSTRPTCSTTSAAASWPSATPTACSSRAVTGEGLDELGDRDRGRVRAHAARRRAAAAVRRGRPARRAARRRRRPRARGHAPRASASSARLPAVVAERFDRYAFNGAARLLDRDAAVELDRLHRELRVHAGEAGQLGELVHVEGLVLDRVRRPRRGSGSRGGRTSAGTRRPRRTRRPPPRSASTVARSLSERSTWTTTSKPRPTRSGSMSAW